MLMGAAVWVVRLAVSTVFGLAAWGKVVKRFASLYEDFGLQNAVELFNREELVTQPGVERLDPSVLPGLARLDVDRAST